MRSYWRHVVLSGLIGCSDMTASTTFYLQDGTKIEATQPTNQRLRIVQADRDVNDADGSYFPPVRSVEIAKWETTDQRVLNVEIRAWLAAAEPRTVANTHSREPRVTYWLEYGLGGFSASTPDIRGPASDSRMRAGAVLPARGLVTRVCARSVELHVRYEGAYPLPGTSLADSVNPAPKWIDVQTSFMPVDSNGLPWPPSAAFSYPDAFTSGRAPFPMPFPAEASEFRIVQQNGRPYAPGYVDIMFTNSVGGILQNLSNQFLTWDRSEFADWTPISPRMKGWQIANPFPSGNPDYPTYADGGPDDSQAVHFLYR